MKIQGSVFLITGASTRVGREIALYFAERGSNISFSYYLDDEPWQETKQAIEALGVECLATKVEVRDAQQINALVKNTTEKFGRIDVLINNASVWLKTPLWILQKQNGTCHWMST